MGKVSNANARKRHTYYVNLQASICQGLEQPPTARYNTAMRDNYRGCRATIMGLGHFGGGVAAARWLARQWAIVTVSDQAPPDELDGPLRQLAGVPLANMHLGGHRVEDFAHAELIVVNPAVRPDCPWLPVARDCGARLVTELELFIENCPARSVGVTGSNGKSTTAAMTASILQADGRRTFLGGNLGGSLLERLAEIDSDDWVVLEISSFQLWHFSPAAKMPHVAVATGCAPNHLDWHSTFADYANAKKRMLLEQTAQDFAVLNVFDLEVCGWAPLVRGRQVELSDPPELQVPGIHNRVDAALAAAAARAVGCGEESIRRGLANFRGLPQRLELVATVAGRRFYNDSTATTPESTIAALKTLTGPAWLLAGGKPKGFDFAPLADETVARAAGAALFGSARHELFEKIRARSPQFPCVALETMEESFGWCWQRSRPGETIVLSPACASTDQFRNFHQRGLHFNQLVRRLRENELHGFGLKVRPA